ncbi:MAG: hypothetical protein ILP07_07850, partial [Treponema sp.]|nr:hypothetical protein [Treponema sp.]
MKKTLGIIFLFALSACLSFAAPSGALRTVLDEMNMARTAPSDYAATRLEPLLSGDKTPYQRALAECIKQLNSMEPLPALTWGDGLASCADEVVKSKCAGVDYPEISERIGKYCNWKGCTESLVSGQSVPRSIVIKLLVDSESAKSVNRNNVLSKEYSHVGLSMAPHKEEAYICCMDFATGYFSFDAASQKALLTKNGAKSLVSELNFARTKPRDYVKTRLMPLYSGGNSRYQKALGELIDEMNGMVAVNQLAFSEELYSSAKDWTDFQTADVTEEPVAETADGDTEAEKKLSWEDRLRKYRSFGTVAESVAFGSGSVQAYVADLLIDEGNKESVNRRNLLSSVFTHAGASVGVRDGVSICCVDLGTWYDVNTVPTEAFDLLSDRAPKQILEEINFARTNPTEYVKTRLEPLLTDETDETQKAIKELIRKMLGMPAQSPMIYVRTLENAAKEWVRSQSSTADTAYDQNWEARIGKYCMWNGGSESLYFGSANPENMVREMLIDADNPSRSRRENILSRVYTHIGAATGVHAKYEGICLIEFVGDYLEFKENALKSQSSRLGKGISLAEQNVIAEINFAR